MTAAVPALGLVALGGAVAVLGATTPVAIPTASGPVASLLEPAVRSLAVGSTIALGVIQMLGGTALLAAGWFW